MFSSNIKSCLVAGLVLYELVGWQTVEARITGQYFYGLSAEDHSDKSNEVSSIFGLGVSDNFISSKFQTQYDLNSRLVYDHENNIRNEQYSGDFTGKYTFIQPSLWWNVFAKVDVIPVDTGIEIDNLTSQNLSTISTGPTISLWKNLRGKVDLTALSSITSYSDSNLDSKGEDISLNYFYPSSAIMSFTYSLNYQSVSFDDVSNTANDYDLLAVGITIMRGTPNANFVLKLEHSDIDNISNPSRQNTIELTGVYQVSENSNIAFEISDSLQSATDFNRLGDNPDNAIFTPALFKNKRFQLSYARVTTDTSYNFQIFTNQLENTFDTLVASEKTRGAIFSFSNAISDNLNLYIGLESTDNDTLNVRFDELLVSTTYTRRHSKRLFSEFEFAIEKDRVNNVDSNDTRIQYRITSTLF